MRSGLGDRGREAIPALAFTIALLLSVSIAQLVTGGENGDAASASPRGGTTTAAPTTTAPLPGDLGTLLLADVPAGFVVVPDHLAEAGPQDASAMAAREDDPAAAARLLDRTGFVRGHLRAWSDPDGRIIVALVGAFDSEEGAQQYLDALVFAVKLQSAGLFDAPGIPGSQGITQRDDEDGDVLELHSVVFRRGALVFQVGMGGQPGATTPDGGRDVAMRQWTKP